MYTLPTFNLLPAKKTIAAAIIDLLENEIFILNIFNRVFSSEMNSAHFLPYFDAQPSIQKFCSPYIALMSPKNLCLEKYFC